MKSNTPSRSSYMPQLDALRFFAVLLVMIEHWAPGTYTEKICAGSTGVLFFFVLSGYLITGNLFVAGQKWQQGITSRKFILKQFYFRRLLRIAPAYYFVFFIVLLVPGFNYSLRRDFGWYLVFLNNWKIYLNRDWGTLGHTWTLAVEEQFYLIWPMLVLYLPNRKVWKGFLGMFCFSVLARELILGYVYRQHPADWKQGYDAILTPYFFDAFALGGLLAYQKQFLRIDPVRFRRMVKWLLSISSLAWVLILIIQPEPVKFFAEYVLVPMISVCLIHFASSGIGGLAGRILDNKFLIFLGRISYGLYLYHYLAPMAWFIVGNRLLSITELSHPLRFIVYFMMTLGVSWLSWVVIEQPLMRLKRYFSYSKLTQDIEKEVVPQ